jgi:aryl-phospho-beta-D-glucosidase BglC (GH1 family)
MVNKFKIAAVLMVGGLTAALSSAQLPEPAPEKLPIWRGFNLLEKFYKGNSSSGPYKEDDFKLISEWGFNFVRLPMDYRIWIKDGDWTQIDEAAFADLDQAVAFGRKYNIHVCMNFHRAPGYTVANPPESTSLWTDPQAQRVCALHWAYFARRYKDVPNSHLSFNLLNEPADVDAKTYLLVVEKLAAAIRAEDPDRLIIADGLRWGQQPCQELVPLHIAQATRGYEPFALTHYKASWVNGADQWATPEWPVPLFGGGFLFGPAKPDLRSPMLLNVDLYESAALTITVGTVSHQARLVVRREDEELFSQDFKPGPGQGPWKEVVFKSQWNSYQNIYDRPYDVPLPAGQYTVTIENTSGDWMTITGLTLTAKNGQTETLTLNPKWGQPNELITIVSTPQNCSFQAVRRQDAEWLWQNFYARWSDFRKQGSGAMVGEWGAYNKTPHEVTLRWMEDDLKTFRRAGLGWALWNFRGSFGILDSGRADVQYEDFNGRKLDRKMLQLLQKY